MVADLPSPPPAYLADLLVKPRQLAVSVNGLRFTYLEWGNPAGPLVLCLHGFPDSAHSWDGLGETLGRAGYRVVAPFTRGYAPSERPADGDYSAGTLGRDALGLMDALGARRAVVIGHDWGALAAYAAAGLAPERVSKLVAVAIPHPAAAKVDLLGRASHFLAYPLPGAPERFMANDGAGWDQIVHKWSPHWQPTAAEREEALRAFRRPGGATAIFGYYRSLLADTLARRLPRLARLSMPTLMVYGLEDGALDASQFEGSRAWCDGPLELVGLPGVGHFPQRERPREFEAAVLRHLRAK